MNARILHTNGSLNGGSTLCSMRSSKIIEQPVEHSSNYSPDTLMIEQTDLPILPRVSINFSAASLIELRRRRDLKARSKVIKKNGRQLSYSHRIDILHLNKVHNISVNQISLMVKNHFLTVKKIVDEFEQDPDSLSQALTEPLATCLTDEMQRLLKRQDEVQEYRDKMLSTEKSDQKQFSRIPAERAALLRSKLKRRQPCGLLLVDSDGEWCQRRGEDGFTSTAPVKMKLKKME